MSNLQPIEIKNQRVLLTNQLAEEYGTTSDTITKNFNRNADRYQEGKHFYALEGDDKRDFLNLGQFDLGLKNAKVLYLWTEKGALLHAKSLNTDRAWEVYDRLVENYFKVQALPKPMTQAEILAGMAQVNLELERKVMAIEQTTEKVQNKLNTAIEIFAKPLDNSWREGMNDKINQMCMTYGLNYQVFKGDLYAELEQIAKCDITIRQTRLRNRLKDAGATYKERQAVSKIDVIERDPKLKVIFEGIVRKYQAKYIA